MRLICPNCDAQYEVDASVIPPDGRDVQCSSCGHTWFQPPEGAEAEDIADPAVAEVQDTTDPIADTDFEEAETEVEDLPEFEAEPEEEPAAAAGTSAALDAVRQMLNASSGDEKPSLEPEPESDPEPEDIIDFSEVDDEPDYEPEPAPEPEPEPEYVPVDPEPEPEELAPASRRGLDDKVADVLREEAEREVAARRAEGHAQPLESQPDLGLPDAAVSSAAAGAGGLKDRIARLRGVPSEDEGEKPTGARSELLPDIEEINSTLRANGSRDDDGGAAPSAPAVQANRNGFGRGFGFVVLIFAILFGIYKASPTISVLVPAAEPTLTVFAGMVDKLLLTINGMIGGQ